MRFLHVMLGIVLMAIVSACQTSGVSTSFEAKLPVSGDLIFR